MKTIQITFTGSVSQIRTRDILCQSTRGHLRTHARRPLHFSLPLPFEEQGPRPLVGAVRRPGCPQEYDTRFICFLPSSEGFPGGSVVKNLPAKQETRVTSLAREDPLEKRMATHSSILAWRIPWTEEPGVLQSVGSQRVGHD